MMQQLTLPVPAVGDGIADEDDLRGQPTVTLVRLHARYRGVAARRGLLPAEHERLRRIERLLRERDKG